MFSGDEQVVQGSHQAGATTGELSLVPRPATGSIITPLVGETLFQSVPGNAPLGWARPWVALFAGATDVTVSHGTNTVQPMAFLAVPASGLPFHVSQ